MNEKIVRDVQKMLEMVVLVMKDEYVEMGKWMSEKIVRIVQRMQENVVLEIRILMNHEMMIDGK